MKVSIDFSVYTDVDGAFGYVSGEIDVIESPQVGDTISFISPSSDLVIDSLLGFDGHLKVTDRVIAANRSDSRVMLALSDVGLAKKDDAVKLMAYMEKAFGLFASKYE